MVAERFALHTLDAMMPASCFQGNGPSNQTSASGMNSLQFGPGSPMMNRIGGIQELKEIQVLQVIRPQVPRCKGTLSKQL